MKTTIAFIIDRSRYFVTGAIAGIVIGSIVCALVIIVVVAVIICCRRLVVNIDSQQIL
jgi:hypothetical protein